jgi:hypothetical protein
MWAPAVGSNLAPIRPANQAHPANRDNLSGLD